MERTYAKRALQQSHVPADRCGRQVRLSDSSGGITDRDAPNYGEDHENVYGELLGMLGKDIETLAADGVF